MKNIYQSLLDYTPIGQSESNLALSSHESTEFIRNSPVIQFTDNENGVEASLYTSRRLTLSRMVGSTKKASYDFLQNGTLIAQKITLLDQDKEIKIEYLAESQKWFDVFLDVGNEVNEWYRLSPTNPDPEEHIWYNGDPKNNPPSGLPFDGKINRWDGGHGTYNQSHHVAEVMRQSEGILFEDLDQAKVCDMFNITQEELLALPALLVQKHSLKNE